MKYALSLLILYFSTLSLIAQDTKAVELLEDSQKAFTSLKDYSADIKYTLENPNLGKPVVKLGKMTQSGNKFMVAMEDNRIYCDGKSVWIILLNDDEVTITNYDPDEGNKVERLYHIFGPNTVVRYDGKEGNRHKLSLFLNDDDSDFYQAVYWIDDSSKLIEKAVFHGKNGTTMIYEFSNSVTNSGIPESSFAPNMANYDGFEIYDERN